MKRHKHTPYFYIVASFLGVILIGSLLLVLPISTNDMKGLNYIDALFMTASSVCVTGLSVVPNVGSTLSIFGKVVLAILIEIGGLSFLTIAVFFITITGKRLGMAGTLLMKEALNQNSAVGLVRLIKRIILLSLICQGIGVIVNLFVFIPYYGDIGTGIGVSIFHSISAFNNAGFDIFGYDTSMIVFHDNILLNINTMFLIITGGLGFIVIYDVVRCKNFKNLSIHSKIVLITSAVLILVGAAGFKLTMNNLSFLEALFQSVTARTAGFATIDMNDLSNGAYMLMLFLMFVGASPCSTGGGVKTTSLFVVVASIIALAKGTTPKAFKRKIANQSIIKALSLITISILYILFMILIIAAIEPTFTLRSLVFEVISAFGTVGLSMGITPMLNPAAKLLIALTMFLGRLGPITIISVWNSNWLKNTKDEVQYVEEKILIG